MNRPFAPKFLKNFDNYLLSNKPDLYSTRFHWILFYGLITILGLAGVFWILPNDSRSDTPIATWIGFTAIISILGFVTWLIFLLRFNVFKRFGKISGINRLMVFLLFLLSSVIIIFFTYVPPIIETIKTNVQYKQAELITDINFLNKSICQLEFDSLDKDWRGDTFIVDKKIKDAVGEYDEEIAVKVEDSRPFIDSIASKPQNIPYYGHYPISTLTMKSKLEFADSSVKLNDSTYAFFECPKFVRVSSYNFSDLGNALYKDLDLYRLVFVKRQPINNSTTMQSVIKLIEKYGYEDGYIEKYRLPRYGIEDSLYSERLEMRYRTATVEKNINNIINRKYRFSSVTDVNVYVRILFYIALSITLLLFIFRHTTIKTFFLSILVAVILFILSAIYIAFERNNFNQTFLEILLIYLFAFLIIASLCFKLKTRNVFVGIAINLFTCVVYFLPLLVVGYYYAITVEPFGTVARELFVEQKIKHIIIAEILCPILFLVLLPTLIYKLYRRWFTLPQE